jgi:hypothetical protein
LFEDLKRNYLEGVQAFSAGSEWFSRFKECSDFDNVKVSGKAASGDVVIAKKFPEWLQKETIEGLYLPDNMFNADETVLY